LQAVRDSRLGPPMVARALAIIHTCIYDAWAAYDNKAIATQAAAQVRQRANERKPANVEQAVSYAAYRCATDLFTSNTAFDSLIRELGYDPAITALAPTTPAGVGNAAAAAVLAFRRNDGANQSGTLSGGAPYSDYTHYTSLNAASPVPINTAGIVNVNRWQPLQYTDAGGALVTQGFLAPFWGNVRGFALTSGDQFRSVVSKYGPLTTADPDFITQAREIVDLSANLTDREKMIAEYWADGPRSETPPGHWNLLAQYVSARDKNNLDEDVRLFFALTNAIFDAGIVAWDAKREFDSVRPITAIPYLFRGQQIRCWGGPGKGTVTMDGAGWIPYQAATFPTPPFPEFISGHSTFSAAGAQVLRMFTGKDDFGASVSFSAGASGYEPGSPASPVTLRWETFTAAADEAGLSRRYGGIHFKAADLAGRDVGRLVAEQAFARARQLWDGRNR
jgi:hypothetical protein